MTLDDVLKALGALPEAQRQQAIAAASAAVEGRKWTPNPGPQTDAFFHPADILLYGGQGGGGKSDLGLGLAFTAHHRSLVLRRRYTNLDALTERAIEINGTRDGFNGSPPPKLKTADGRVITFGANQHPGDEEGFQGQPYDYKYFDEAVQFLESQIRFHLGWLRSTKEGQRVRAVLGTNPPVDAQGGWIVGMFRPWLDITYDKPAKPGELRWFVTAPDGTDVEVDSPARIQLPGMREAVQPLSRSFISAALRDNPYLVDTGYQAKLDALPEPLRSAVRDGNFMAARSDAEFQVIPTNWVISAQERWTARPPEKTAMTAMGFDPAGGGGDVAALAARYGGWYAEIVTRGGEETADGSRMAALVLVHRRDACPVVVDMGGGYGGAVTQRMKDNGVAFIGFNAAGKSTAQTVGPSKLGFYNKRAEAWWRFREALDPDQEGGSAVALPPDPELRAELTAPTWELKPTGILVESKDDIRKRLGRSTNKADAAVMCLAEGAIAAKRAAARRSDLPAHANAGFSNIKQRYGRR